MVCKVYLLFVLAIVFNTTCILAFEICETIIIKGPIEKNKSPYISSNKSIENCEIVLGSIQIYTAILSSEIQFKKLVEVTDYVLIFQPYGVKSLDEIFPKLTIIRGDRLYQNYALTLFLSTQLLNLNFKSLKSIQRGSVFISRLSSTCYVRTINWNYIIKENKAPGLITTTNNDCHLEKCQKNCNNYCWSERECQNICPNECENNCNIKTGTCCENSNCMHCNNHTQCVACKNLRNFLNGECVKECPADTLLYENHSCISFFDCSVNSTHLTRNYYNYDNKFKCL